MDVSTLAVLALNCGAPSASPDGDIVSTQSLPIQKQFRVTFGSWVSGLGVASVVVKEESIPENDTTTSKHRIKSIKYRSHTLFFIPLFAILSPNG